MFAFISMGKYFRQEWGGTERGWDRERSASCVSNSGHPTRKGIICRRSAHEAIGTDAIKYFSLKEMELSATIL